MTDDAELLRRYAEEGSEAAFAELVRRHIELVYAAALRQARGNAPLAQDVAQTVFTDLARKAGSVARHTVLAAWLHTATRFAAAKAIRAENRWQLREREANALSADSDNWLEDSAWAQMQPVLDEVLGELKERERAAILLRFFEKRTLAEVGARLELSETAARSCVDRALDKLHAALARRGVTSTSAALGVVLAQQPAVALPAGLAAGVTGAALAGAGATAAGGWAAAMTFMNIGKIQVGVASAIIAASVTAYVLQGKANAALQRDIAALAEQQAGTAVLRTENRRLTAEAAEVESLRGVDGELQRLAQGVEAQKQRNEEMALEACARAEQGKIATALSFLVEEEKRLQVEVQQRNEEGGKLIQAYRALTEQAQAAAPEQRTELQAQVAQALAVTQAKIKEARAAEAQVTEIQKRIHEIDPSVPLIPMGTFSIGPAKPGQPTLR